MNLKISRERCEKTENQDDLFNDDKTKGFHRLYLDVFFKSYAAVEMRFILPIGESSLLSFI